MIRDFIGLVVAVLAAATPCTAQQQPQPTLFSPTEVRSDLSYLYQTLQDTHYDLFAYTPKPAYDAVFERLRAAVGTDSLTLLQTTSLFQELTSAANNGHTEIGFPIQSYIAYSQENGTLFPLELAHENDAWRVGRNHSSQEVPPHAEVVSINGRPITDVVADIYPLISAERTYFKNAKLELFSFPRLYWQAFGRVDSFQVVVHPASPDTLRLAAVPMLEGFEYVRDEVISARLELRQYDQAAYLNPGSFSGEETQYQRFIDSAFTEINASGTPNLIIDLRNNGGGDDSFSNYLVSYLAAEPFGWCSRLAIKASAQVKAHARQHYDTTQTYWQTLLAQPDGTRYNSKLPLHQPQPPAKRYVGNVYVLINRQSHSQATVAAAQLRDLGLASLAGEETGEYPTLYASQFSFPLPTTGIVVRVSKGKIVRLSGEESTTGLVPDMVIGDHLLDKQDDALQQLLRRLN